MAFLLAGLEARSGGPLGLTAALLLGREVIRVKNEMARCAMRRKRKKIVLDAEKQTLICGTQMTGAAETRSGTSGAEVFGRVSRSISLRLQSALLRAVGVGSLGALNKKSGRPLRRANPAEQPRIPVR